LRSGHRAYTNAIRLPLLEIGGLSPHGVIKAQTVSRRGAATLSIAIDFV